MAPLAMTAFPEAYEQFKQATLLLLYGHEHEQSPVADVWALDRRTELAGQLARTIRQAAGAKHSSLQDANGSCAQRTLTTAPCSM